MHAWPVACLLPVTSLSRLCVHHLTGVERNDLPDIHLNAEQLAQWAVAIGALGVNGSLVDLCLLL